MDLETLTQKFQSYTGLVLVFFIALHLAGVIFAGINPDAFEIYASNLHSSIFLPYFEIVLATAFIIHIFLTIKKVLKNNFNKISLKKKFRTVQNH